MPDLHKPTYSYQAYGLNIQSDIYIDGLVVVNLKQDPDITISNHGLPDEALQQVDPESRYGNHLSDVSREFWTACHAKYYCIRFDQGPGFTINHSGSTIWVDWPSTVSAKGVSLYLIGILGFVLRLRGIICLHASAVMIEGLAIAITGCSGAGKSTLAAAFVKLGHQVLSDDILPLDVEPQHTMAYSGYTRLRLWPDASESLVREGGLPQLLPDWEKQYLDLSKGGVFHGGARSLKAIYVLGDRVDPEQARIDLLVGAESVMALVANTYRGDLLTADLRSAEFRQIERIVGQVPVRKLYTPNTLETLPAFCKKIRRTSLRL